MGTNRIRDDVNKDDRESGEVTPEVMWAEETKRGTETIRNY